jgi:hypothetical protein
VVDENAAHHFGGYTKELRAVLPRDTTLIDQPEVGLVNERCRLQGMTGSFASKVGRRAAAQFLVDERHEQIARGDIAVAPGL